MSSNLIQNKNNTSVATPKKQSTLRDYIKQYIPEIEKALPSCGVTADRFARLMTSALSANPKLASCTPQSFLGAMMASAQLGLEPNTSLGQAYLIPYGDNVQFQLGYQGLLALCYRSGEIANVSAEVVHKNDEFQYELGLHPTLVHKPCLTGDRGEAVAYYATWNGKNGGYGFAVMSKADVEEHRKKFSKARNSPWDTNFDSMALKTVLKRCLKYAPISSSMMREVNADETIKTNFRMEDVVSGDVDILDVQPDVIEVEGTVDDVPDFMKD